VQFSVFPSSTLAPLVYYLDDQTYNKADFYRYNLFDLLTAGTAQPYQIKLFHGERELQENQRESLYGAYYTASFHSRIGNHIVPWHRYGIGLEHRTYRSTARKSEIYQLVNAGFVVFGYDNTAMTTVFTASYSRKGLFPQRFISMENISFRVAGRYSFASSLDRSIESTMGRSLALKHREKVKALVIISAGAKLFVPVDLDLETMAFTAETPYLSPLFNLEMRIPKQNLLFE
jgi:hypothetical protein